MIDKDKIYYVRHEGKVCQCKIISAKTFYTDDEEFFEAKLNIAGAGIVVYNKTAWNFEVYKTPEDCLKRKNKLNFNKMLSQNTDRLLAFKEVGLDSKHYSRFGCTYSKVWAIYYYFDGFNTRSTFFVGNTKVCYFDHLRGKFELVDGIFSDGKYRTREECESKHQAQIVTFDDCEDDCTADEQEFEVTIKVKATSLEEAKSKVTIK